MAFEGIGEIPKAYIFTTATKPAATAAAPNPVSADLLPQAQAETYAPSIQAMPQARPQIQAAPVSVPIPSYAATPAIQQPTSTEPDYDTDVSQPSYDDAGSGPSTTLPAVIPSRAPMIQQPSSSGWQSSEYASENEDESSAPMPAPETESDLITSEGPGMFPSISGSKLDELAQRLGVSKKMLVIGGITAAGLIGYLLFSGSKKRD
jgi:hypothetical protein